MDIELINDVVRDDARYIKLDLSNIPTSPTTNGFARNGDTLELWWNGILRQSWTTATVVGYLMLEQGGALLQENNDPILLES